ncbi:MAG: rRNA maturation RNase YbeY [Simkania negevensis]|nr:rRNA maturation RNase YbeY [Simkania negevensis]
MKIICNNSQDSLAIPLHQIKRIVQALAFFKEVSSDEVIYHFVDKQAIADLHYEIFNDPTPTDCITLPIDTPEEEAIGYQILGEAFICPEIALEYAKKNKVDPYEELILYVVHTFLHLLGFEDKTTENEKIMRQEERKCLDFLKEQNISLRP